jgi:hypothetical protein
VDGDSAPGTVTAVVVENKFSRRAHSEAVAKHCLEAWPPAHFDARSIRYGELRTELGDAGYSIGYRGKPDANGGRGCIKNILHRREGLTSTVSLK